MKFNKLCFVVLSLTLVFFSCKQNESAPEAPVETVKKEANALPDWAKNATLYEVNVRQFTEEGTFKAFEAHLPRLKEMGVDILWLMPIYPISEKERKGTLGSPYAVTDYKGLNPEFGTKAEFVSLVNTIHRLGMYIILDFVPNHTGWDSQWLTDHPEWFTQDAEGNPIDPIDPGTGESWGWTDVADLNYDNHEMRKEMISDMAFWLTEYDIDGFRMDVAHNVPQDFWDAASAALHATKNSFMLAEAEVHSHLNSKAFHANYGWNLHHKINEYAKGELSASELMEATEGHTKNHQHGFPINFTSNHDENTWAGTVFDRMGEAHKAMAVFAFTAQGMPLLYGGQEEPLKHRLEFFEKDNIGFDKYEYAQFYKVLFDLKHKNEALWNGEYGDKEPTWYSSNPNLIAFERNHNGHSALVLINAGNEAQSFIIESDFKGNEVFESKSYELKKGDNIEVPAYGYKVYSSI